MKNRKQEKTGKANKQLKSIKSTRTLKARECLPDCGVGLEYHPMKQAFVEPARDPVHLDEQRQRPRVLRGGAIHPASRTPPAWKPGRSEPKGTDRERNAGSVGGGDVNNAI